MNDLAGGGKFPPVALYYEGPSRTVQSRPTGTASVIWIGELERRINISFAFRVNAQRACCQRTCHELCSLYVPEREMVMVRAVVEEALALASITLFLATIAVWAQVLGVL